jgi:hypothetical protein
MQQNGLRNNRETPKQIVKYKYRQKKAKKREAMKENI